MVLFFIPFVFLFTNTFLMADCLKEDLIPEQYIVRLKKINHNEFVPQAIADDAQFRSYLKKNNIGSKNIFDINSAQFNTFSELSATPPSTYVIAATETIANNIKSLPYVSSVENDCYYHIQGNFQITQNTNDPLIDQMWGLKKINAAQAWDINRGLASTIVAVSDTGVDYLHEDLKSNMWVNPKEIPNNGVDDDSNGCVDDIYGCDFADGDGNPMPDNTNLSHGTHVAGTVAAVGNNSKGVTGVVQTAKIMGLKGFNSFAQGDGSALLQTIYFAVNNGAKVINCSWGRKGSASQADRDAFDYAFSKGVVVVVAAGNNNLDARDFVPANLNNVITVAATDNDDQIGRFSNWGTTIELAAPGGKGYDDFTGEMLDGILSTLPNNTYGKYIGTSMAAPHVAGLAALILSINPNFAPADVLKVMQDGADVINVTTFNSNRKFTYKRINASKSAQLALNTLSPGGGSSSECLPGQICKTNIGSALPSDFKNAFTQGAGCGSIAKFEQKKWPTSFMMGLFILPLFLLIAIRLYLIDQKQ